jgi:hypothetical protein
LKFQLSRKKEVCTVAPVSRKIIHLDFELIEMDRLENGQNGEKIERKREQFISTVLKGVPKLVKFAKFECEML